MTNLRTKLIRLAHSKPELRSALLPILKVAALPERDGQQYKIETKYKDAEGKVQTSSDFWLANKMGKPTKTNFEKVVNKGLEEGGEIIEAKLTSRGETIFTVKGSKTGAASKHLKVAARPSEKMVRFPEGVMTEKDWVQRYADRVDEYKKNPDFDRRKFNQMDSREQKEYDERLKAKSNKPGFRAWHGDTFYDISKDTYEWAKQEGIKTASTDKEAARWTMPRSSYIPKDEPTLQRRKNTPEGLEIWTWESYNRKSDKVAPYAIAFQGKADKPMWYHSFRDINSQEKMIQETVQDYESALKRKLDRQEEKKNFQHGLSKGDILVASWGYDQTNIDYYQITDVVGKSVVLREIGKKDMGSDGYGSDKVMPDAGKFVGPAMKKIPQVGGVSLYIKISESQTARKWDGKPDRQTSSGWGH